MKPSIAKFGLKNEVYHLDDSARPHRTKNVFDWHHENGIQKIIWLGNSPDLNPIENLWAIMKSKLNRIVCKNKQKLIENITRIWYNDLDIETLRNLALSMPERIEKCLKNKGYSTKY